jgi:hypothetical protein
LADLLLLWHLGVAELLFMGGGGLWATLMFLAALT